MDKVSQSRNIQTDDLLEPIFDESINKIGKELFNATLPEFVKDLPILKYVKTGVDAYTIYKTLKLQRRLKAFLQSLINGNANIDDFKELPNEHQTQVVDILITELDMQTDDLQSEALALLFIAYISNKIDRQIFLGISHELKNINPLAFYFNVDGYHIFPAEGTIAIEGPLQYLPSAFYTDRTEEIQASSFMYLTNLGKDFFEYVYAPMATKHII